MRKMLPFVLGVLVGTVAATAWANYSPRIHAGTPDIAAASMNPFEMMTYTRSLPHSPHFDAH